MGDDQCRICLSFVECPYKLSDMIEDQAIWEIINVIADVSVSVDDHYPQTICVSCSDKLAETVAFKNEIERSDEALHSHDPEYVVQVKVEDNPIEEVAIKDDPDTTVVVSKRGRPRKQKMYEEYLTDELTEITETKDESEEDVEPDDDDDSDVPLKTVKGSKKRQLTPVKKRVKKRKESETHETHQCCLCQEIFNDGTELTSHVETTHQEKLEEILKIKYTQRHKHECQYCHRKFIRKGALLKHFESANYEEPPRNRSKPAKRDKGENSAICTVCGKLYYDKYDLELHELRMHATVRNVVCPHPGCGKRFAAEKLLKKHVRFHGERKHICETCGKGFIEPNDLRNHSYVHKKIKPLQCPLCPRTFTHKPVLETHILSHSGQNIFACEQCDKTYKWKEDLRKHFMAEHLGIFPYKCKYCGKGYTGSSNRTYHEKRCNNYVVKHETPTSSIIVEDSKDFHGQHTIVLSPHGSENF